VVPCFALDLSFNGRARVEPRRYFRTCVMKKLSALTALIAVTFATLTPTAHADVSDAAHQFKSDVKTAGKETGHAFRDAGHAVAHGAKATGHAVAHGAKTAGHAVANTTSHGYHKTKNWVKEKTS